MPESNRSNLSSALLCAATLAALAGLAAGCGSSDSLSRSNTPSAPGATSATSAFAGRAYSSQIPLAGTQRATLQIQVDAANNAAGTLLIEDTSRAAAPRSPLRAAGRAVISSSPLSGSVNPQTGALRMTGTVAGANGQGQAVTVSGTLPGGTNAAGACALALGGQTYNGTFAPNVAASPVTTASPSPGTSPTPNASPSPGGSPTPVPSPVGSPGATLTELYFPLRTGDTYTYTSTNSSTDSSGNNVSDSTQRTGNRVTWNGNAAYRVEYLNDTGSVSSVDYENIAGSTYTLYGTESLNADGTVVFTDVYNPPYTFPLTVLQGNGGSFSYNRDNKNTDGSIDHVVVAYTLTPQGFTRITVPAGTFDVLKVAEHITYSSGTANGTGSNNVPNHVLATDGTVYLAQNIGEIRTDDTTTDTMYPGKVTTSSNVLKSAVVNGVKYGQ